MVKLGTNFSFERADNNKFGKIWNFKSANFTFKIQTDRFKIVYKLCFLYTSKEIISTKTFLKTNYFQLYTKL